MESNMVENQILYPQESLFLVENYFTENFICYQLIKDSVYMGYWWVEYLRDVVRICFDGDIGGYFYVKIFIEDTEYSLWQYDRSIIEKMKTSNDNILYQLNVLKRFLNEVGY
jgi:hypothetical protein